MWSILLGMQVFSLIVSSILLFGSVRVYVTHRLTSLKLLIVASTMLFVAYLSHFLGSICGSLVTAFYLFKLYLVTAAFAVYAFLVLFIYIKYPRMPLRTYLALFLAGMWVAERLFFVTFGVYTVDSMIFREPPQPWLLDASLVSLSIAWVIGECIDLFLKQKKIVPRRLRSPVNYSLVAGVGIIVVIVITVCAAALGFIAPAAVPLISISLLPLMLMILAIALIRYPELLQILVVQSDALLVFSKVGVFIYGIVSRRRLQETAMFLSSFISALSQFGREVLAEAGRLAAVVFERQHMVLEFTKHLVICLLAPITLPLHMLLIRRIRDALADMEVPEVVTDEIVESIRRKLLPFIELLFGAKYHEIK